MSWGIVAGAAVSVVGGYLTSKNQSKSNAKAADQYAQTADPYGPYRDQAAQKLNKLMSDPTSIEDTGEYKSRLDAAARTMAAQGYTGSGNALAAAATAGGDVYQQAFNNLALTSGAGQSPGSVAQGAATLATNNASSNAANNASLINSGVYWGQKAYGAYQGSNYNTPSVPDSYYSNAPSYSGNDLDISYDV